MSAEPNLLRFARENRAEDQSVTPNPGPWRKSLDGDAIDEVVNAGDLTRSRLDSLLQNDASDELFMVAVTMWGSGSRTLNFPKWIAQALKERRDEIRRVRFLASPLERHDDDNLDSYELAFARLWQENWTPAIKGFGTSFGTKLLYWGARQQQKKVVPLIYDARVHGALVTLGIHSGLGTSVLWDHPWECVRLSCYSAYCRWADAAAAHLNALGGQSTQFRADDVEYWLFRFGGSEQSPKAAQETGCKQPELRVEPDEDSPQLEAGVEGDDLEQLLRWLAEAVPRTPPA